MNPSQSYIIKNGYDQSLDQLRDLVANAQQRILEFEAQEQQRTGINSLKVRYNQIYGYLIEITKPNLHLVPADYIRQQTLMGKERFTLPSLQQLEHDIRYAEDAINELVLPISHPRKAGSCRLSAFVEGRTAYALNRLDALFGFAALPRFMVMSGLNCMMAGLS